MISAALFPFLELSKKSKFAWHLELFQIGVGKSIIACLEFFLHSVLSYQLAASSLFFSFSMVNWLDLLCF